eukprot:gene14961-12511_t
MPSNHSKYATARPAGIAGETLGLPFAQRSSDPPAPCRGEGVILITVFFPYEPPFVGLTGKLTHILNGNGSMSAGLELAAEIMRQYESRGLHAPTMIFLADLLQQHDPALVRSAMTVIDTELRTRGPSTIAAPPPARDGGDRDDDRDRDGDRDRARRTAGGRRMVSRGEAAYQPPGGRRPPPPPSKPPPPAEGCVDFLKWGRCDRGATCRFSHCSDAPIPLSRAVRLGDDRGDGRARDRDRPRDGGAPGRFERRATGAGDDVVAHYAGPRMPPLIPFDDAPPALVFTVDAAP